MLAPVTFAWIAIIAAIVWKMVYGMVVYARPILGDWWMKEVGLGPDSVKKEDATRGILWAVVLSIVGTLLFAVLWSWTGASGASEGAMLGALVGLGFAGSSAMVHAVFEGRSMALSALYLVYHIVEFAVIGVLFGLLA